jgi:Protein of unknown function (DUF2470)
VGSTRLRRPPAPADAERARSLALRGGTATLVGTGCPRSTPLVHHVRADGSAVLLLADDEPLLDRVRYGGTGPGPDADRDGSTRSPGAVSPAGRAAVMLELADRAPVDLREPVRGLLWITGWLWLPDRRAARRMALQVADACPNDRLLELDHGATLVRLDPGSAVLADGDGSAALGPVDLAAARPDPFCRLEEHWLGHLEEAHPDVMAALGRHLPRALRGPGTRVRPLGVDRCGLRLRVEAPDRDHDVRLAFESEATTPDELRVQVHKLVGCPRS